MTKTYDAIVIGAGHNGLICAAYLAKAGQNVLVVEAAEDVGGAAVTRPFADGFQVSAGAHLLHLLQPSILKDLGITLDLAAQDIKTIGLNSSGDHLTLDAKSVSGQSLSDKDVAAYSAFKTRMLEYAGTLAPMMMKKPPRLAGGDIDDTKTGIKLGWDLRFGLGKDKMSDFLRIVGINIFDVLEEQIDNDHLKGVIAWDAVIGHHMGPRTPNSVLSYLYRLTGELHSTLAIPKGGMGAATQALRQAAEKAGVEIRTACPVASVSVEDSRANGVVLESGETLFAQSIVSNADPKTTFLHLVGGRHLEGFFAHRINNIRMRGNAAKLHLALEHLPEINGLDTSALGQRLVIAPDMKYVERAFDHAKYGEMSEHPAMEITIPSRHDPSLAPQGKHVMSILVQYAPYALKDGWDTNAKDHFTNIVLDHIAHYAPNIREHIIAKELLTPADMEHEFRMHGGHWHHGEFALDQLLMLRPVYGAAQYSTPLDGLYLCGAGAHPGGGVMGAPGHNAAQAVINEEARS